MKKPDTGVIVASLLCTLLVGGGAFLGLSLLGQADIASNPKPSPRAAQTAEAEAEDGFPDVDWDWWKKENPRHHRLGHGTGHRHRPANMPGTR